MNQPNPSIAQARAIADELGRHGIEAAFLSPGSRSGALGIALEESPAIRVFVVIDERSAAFQALGWAKAIGRPAVCVATSGTAGANYLPGVVEADASLAPLILLTADRPPELRGIGANQTIEQLGIYSGRVRWECDVATAENGFDGNAYWRTVVSQAVARSLGHGGRPGPVHLNLSFREPTVAVSDDGRAVSAPYPFSISGRVDGKPWQESRIAVPSGSLATDIGRRHGVIVAGEGSYDAPRLIDQASRLGWPVLATASSCLRGNQVVTSYHHLLIDGVPQKLAPEVVVWVGRTGPSDRLAALSGLEVPQIQIDRWGCWHDPRRQVGTMVHADPVESLGLLEAGPLEGWAEEWRAYDSRVREALDERLMLGQQLTGPIVARALSDIDWGVMAVASSMPIRDVDAHTVSSGRIVSNRGASGIDGFISTALGVAAAGSGAIALSGDLSFLHDVSALSNRTRPDLVLLVVDNNGGGLFDLLPAATHAEAFEKLFVAPHDQDLVAVAASFGWSASRIGEAEALAGEIGARLAEGGLHVLVLPVDREADLKQRKELDEAAVSALRGMD